jgi:hypothetical protein
VSDWIAFERAVPVAKVATIIPRDPGKYAFFVNDIDVLPQAFRSEAATRADQRLLYIGKADVSLFTRAYEQECLHRRPGTFFRSVGAMLGYRSPKGGRNYEFSKEDKQAVASWIATNLRIAWTSEPVLGSHGTSEGLLITQHRPLLNLSGNPRKFGELQRLRDLCRRGQSDSA